jgi:hypothetical protein
LLAPNKRVQRPAEETKTPGVRGLTDPKKPIRERVTFAHMRSAEFVPVIPHKNEWGPRFGYLFAVSIHANRNFRITPKGKHERLHKSRPFTLPLSSKSVSFLNDTRVESDTGIVEKYSAVDLTNVDTSDNAVERSCDRLFEIW